MITDFLYTKQSVTDLRTVLNVVREFKAGESLDEWTTISFDAWAKLEQLEEFLEYLVEGKIGRAHV